MYPLPVISIITAPKASKLTDHKITLPYKLFALVLGPAKAETGEKIKEYNLQYCPAGEFFKFYFKLPRFHQLLSVYIITLRRVIWLFPEEKQLLLCLWSPELPPLCSSVTAAAYSHIPARKLDRGGSGAKASGWNWTGQKNWEVQSSTHNIAQIYVDKYIYNLIFPCCNAG